MQKNQNTKNDAYMQRILKDKILTRLEIVRRYYANEKPADFAKDFGLTPRYIYYVIEAFENHGWRGLVDKRGGAYNVKITDDIEREIVEAFLEKKPLKAKDIALILEKKNIILSKKSIDRVLERHFLKKKRNIKHN